MRAAVGAEALGKSWAGAAPLLAEGGMKIGQMVFQKMDGIPARTYAVTGRYNMDEAVTASKG
jgi:deoxycytidine triphosphate deaminase